MKRLVFVLFMALICGCEDAGEQIQFNAMPDGLKDCHLFRISKSGEGIYVVRCPNSATATSWVVNTGKTAIRHSATVIEEPM